MELVQLETPPRELLNKVHFDENETTSNISAQLPYKEPKPTKNKKVSTSNILISTDIKSKLKKPESDLESLFSRLSDQLLDQCLKLPKHIANLGHSAAFHCLNQTFSYLESIYNYLPKIEKELFLSKVQSQLKQVVNLSELAKKIQKNSAIDLDNHINLELLYENYKQFKQNKHSITPIDLGECFDLFILNSNYSKSIYHRTEYYKHHLLHCDGQAASIGAQSFQEFEELCDNKDLELVQVDLLSQNKEILKLTENILKESKLPYHTLLGSIFKQALDLKSYHYKLIYSANHFDNLSLENAKRLLSILWEKLAPGGKLILSTTQIQNSNLLFLSFTNILKTTGYSQKNMFNLVEEISGYNNIHLELDPFNVFQYLTICK